MDDYLSLLGVNLGRSETSLQQPTPGQFSAPLLSLDPKLLSATLANFIKGCQQAIRLHVDLLPGYFTGCQS